MHCPRDGATLRTETYESSFEVDRCPDCAGVWLDKGELDAIMRKVENDWSRDLSLPEDLVTGAFSAARSHHEPISCPKCGAGLENKEYAYTSQVYVDICPAGCGLWLDAGELVALEKFYERHHDRSRELGFKDLWARLAGAIREARRG